MHIEPGIVTGAKLVLGYATASGAALYTARACVEALRAGGPAPLALRSTAAAGLVFAFFELLPHYPVGVSEVHLILGSTLFLLFGAAPAALGLALGLLAQGLLFAPTDLPQLGMNLTTLLVPLFAVRALAGRIIAPGTPYVDLRYGQALALSTAYQGGVVAWVALWALWGQGAGALGPVVSFGGAYMLVVLIEPLVDLAVLTGAKALHGLRGSALITPRLFRG
ncbi:MAG: energy-coupling factor ABC transporter permease [Antarcticimicrobium sp.]|uniref:energy-coupling factor ABC transporter permease n=1 Tax=Antarcticimicrobium sp. TaxID=2824147 RepID=UPI0026156D69|nr:energy-coupling factor ABC transporter permease [Antarcticimicrobium sp.]MDF1715471.1 energy-coupling factor ABC transporter permease [Antarcticimicrobium sp.]